MQAQANRSEAATTRRSGSLTGREQDGDRNKMSTEEQDAHYEKLRQAVKDP